MMKSLPLKSEKRMEVKLRFGIKAHRQWPAASERINGRHH